MRLICFFFFNDTATTEIYTLSLHDALPICRGRSAGLGQSRFGRSGADLPWPPRRGAAVRAARQAERAAAQSACDVRSEEHTSELQSRQYLVCRLLLEKKKK